MVTSVLARLKSKSLLQEEIYGDSKTVSYPLEMALGQNEKCKIGISIVENVVLGNYSPPP